MNDCIRLMSSNAPSLVPLLRGENQLKVLAALLLEPGRRSTITELVQRTGVPQPSVSREVTALLSAGLLVADREHGRRVFSADVTSSICPELSSLLRKTVGPPVVLRRALEDVRERADTVSGDLGRDVNVSVLSPAGWARPTSGFVRHVRDSPLVTVVDPAEARR